MKTRQKLIMSISTLLLLFLSINVSWCQSESDQNSGHHEIKVNGLHILFESIEISYDYLVGDQSSLGVSFGASFDGNLGYDFIMVPNYKLFFNEKKAAGFFIEANSALYSKSYDDNSFGDDGSTFGFGLGIAIGGKFLNKQGFIGELILGVGRNFLNTDLIGEAYPRFGISIGKRF